MKKNLLIGVGAVSILLNVIFITYTFATKQTAMSRRSNFQFDTNQIKSQLAQREQLRHQELKQFMITDLKLSKEQADKFDYYNKQFFEQFRTAHQDPSNRENKKDVVQKIMLNRDATLEKIVGAKNMEILKWKMSPMAQKMTFEQWQARMPKKSATVSESGEQAKPGAGGKEGVTAAVVKSDNSILSAEKQANSQPKVLPTKGLPIRGIASVSKSTAPKNYVAPKQTSAKIR